MRKALYGWKAPELLPLIALASETDRVHLFLWAQRCSGPFLELYEKRVPGDLRPRKCYEAGWLWAKGVIKMRKARKAILLCHEAAREQEGDPVAMASAKAIAHAASTLYLGRHAMRVAFYGLTALRYLEKPAEPRPFIKKRMRQAP